MIRMWSFYCLLVILFKVCTSQILHTLMPDISFQIVGIFDSNARIQQRAFIESLEHTHFENWRLVPVVATAEKTDSFSVWRALCSNTTIRPVAIFGPQNPITDGAVRDQSFRVGIPHIQAAWQPLDPELALNEDEDEEGDDNEETSERSDEENENQENVDEGNENKESVDEENEKATDESFKKLTINFYPDASEISLAYAKLLKYYKWKNFAVLYEDDFGLLRVQKILAEHTERYPVSVYRLNPDGDNYNIFKELLKSHESRFLLDCHVTRVMYYMRQAAEQNIVNDYQHYTLVTMDAQIIADELIKMPSNITWLSITEYEKLSSAQHFLAQRVGTWNELVSPAVTMFQTEELILNDVANHVLSALRAVDLQNKMPANSPCEAVDEPWSYGAKLQDAILKIRTLGVTGNIEFNETGHRVNYTLYVNQIYQSELNTIGRWESANGDEIDEDSEVVAQGNIKSKRFIVISRKAKPYFYDKPKCEGEDCDEKDTIKYEGFSVDLVDEIFKILRDEMKFDYTYEFVEMEGNGYGKYNNVTKKWDGLIGELLDKRADLAVCDLTITEERKKVLDFSVPFMSLGISILYTKKTQEVPDTFAFLNPYSFEVWMYIATAYCVVSIILFVCSRLSPEDWENPQPCDKDPEELENIWNFKNCTWLTMGSIMTQGCDILPKAVGSRWVCSMWWFFAMIVCQTYIAQLAASMTSASDDNPIDSVESLVKQNKILYGALDGGSTLEFFKNSKDKIYKKVYENILAHPGVLVKSNDEGEKRVLNSKNKYAFFMESCTIEYKLKRNCDLRKVGGELDSKDYGIAMPANSPYRSQINRAILRLKELTILDGIKKTWWDEKYGAKECEKEEDKTDVEGDLEMEHLMGAFLVLIVGLVFCLIITAAEFMNEIRNIVVREKVTHKEAFLNELRTSLNFKQMQKPVFRNPSRAASVADGESLKIEDRQEKRILAIENFLDIEKVVQ